MNKPSRTSAALCPNCAGSLSVDPGFDTAVCPCCGVIFQTEAAIRAWNEKDRGDRAVPYAAAAKPRRKRHPFRWVLLCVLLFFATRFLVSGLRTWTRSAQPSRSSSSSYSAATPRPTSRPASSPRPSSTPRPGSTPGPTAEARSSASGVTPEFRETMDSYEAFFDEYVAFMTGIGEAEDLSYLLRYFDMLDRYGEMMDNLVAIDEDSLSPADEQYYLEVMTRIEKKLLEAALGD